MKILKQEKQKLLKWVNDGKSIYYLLNYLVNDCKYSQPEAKEIIDNIDNIEIFENNNREYNMRKDGKSWFLEEYTDTECTFAVMGNSVPSCYSQMFFN